jgi:1-acyl-sn-glycerol-3-phosphate acyltransferase
VADADVIPIGSGGRPGRGSNRRTTPSSAARALAGPGAAGKKPSPPKNPPASAAEPAARNRPDASRKNGDSSRKNGDSSRKRLEAELAAEEAELAAEEARSEGVGPDLSLAPEAESLAAGAGQFAQFEKLIRDTLGRDGERKVAEFLAFLRRRLTGDYEVDEFGYDEDLTDQVLLPFLRPLAEKWFRVEVRGIENIPETGSALIVANHSGTMPLDGLITQLVVADNANRPLRTLAADLVFKTPFVGELSRKGGATLANNDDAERLLRQGNLVGVWPEGFKGLGKPFSERYKLQRFGRGGFVSAAMRTGVPIVPCSIVGAEEIYPLVGNMASLARLVGVPYIPVTPFFPLLGPLGMVPLPSKWLIEFGEPIRTDEFPDGAADDPMLVFNVTDQVRETIQQTLYALLMQRRSVFF